MAISFYTSDVAVAKTAGDIQALLARRGVARISTLYAENGEAAGLGFTLRTDYGIRDFEMPVRIDGVYAALAADASIPKSKRTREQAQRTAWRIAHALLVAQVALIDAELATLDELMMPFMVDGTGATAYQALRSSLGAIEA